MKFIIDTDVNIFWQEVKGFLLRDEKTNSFFLGIVSSVMSNKKTPELMFRVYQDQELLWAGVQTSPAYPLILSAPQTKTPHSPNPKEQNRLEEQMKFIVEELSLRPLIGVNSVNAVAEAFSEGWVKKKLCTPKIRTYLRLYEIQKLHHPVTPMGGWRCANSLDLSLVCDWILQFHKEAVPHDPVPNPTELETNVKMGIEKQQFFLWEVDGVPVCFVASRRETNSFRWIAPVYTLPEHRGKGYGAALTAVVSQKILESGKIGMLFTDLLNPISNSIYQKIGYQPVCDFKHIGFS